MFGPSRRATTLAGLVAALLASASSHSIDAQSVRPVVIEYVAHGRGKFELVNETLFPMTVVLEPRGFRVDESGVLADVPFDSANIELKLSAMSFRIPPMGTYTVFYEAKAKRLPAWFQVLSAMSGARTTSGLNVRLELPHVVYLLQKEPLKRAAVTVSGFTYDSAAKSAIVELTNDSEALGRVLAFELGGAGRSVVPFGGFPLFPQSRRRVTVPWAAAQTPEHVRLRSANFALEARRDDGLRQARPVSLGTVANGCRPVAAHARCRTALRPDDLRRPSAASHRRQGRAVVRHQRTNRPVDVADQCGGVSGDRRHA